MLGDCQVKLGHILEGDERSTRDAGPIRDSHLGDDEPRANSHVLVGSPRMITVMVGGLRLVNGRLHVQER